MTSAAAAAPASAPGSAPAAAASGAAPGASRPATAKAPSTATANASSSTPARASSTAPVSAKAPATTPAGAKASPTSPASAKAASAGSAVKGAEHRLPGGRGYEILVPPLEPARLRNLPLVVYLHPAGRPEPEPARTHWWPMLRDRGCLLALLRSQGQKMWLAGEEKYIMDVLADVQTRYSVDGKRIILAGQSGGAQVAIFLADHLPGRFRAVVALSASPTVVRGQRSEWFYPARSTCKTCPYFVANPLTQGANLMYWRQVKAKLAAEGASISIVASAGADELPGPPPALAGWLDEVLAGKHPAALPDAQEQAVAKLLAPVVQALPQAIAKAKPAATQPVTKEGGPLKLSVAAPAGFVRAGKEQTEDSADQPMTQIRLEHQKWPISVRAEARATPKPLDEVLAAEELQTIRRGMLYQVYQTSQLAVGGNVGGRIFVRSWKYRVGSITYPDQQRGWVTALFIHAAAPIDADRRQWLTVMVIDETQQPDAAELAAAFRTALASITATPK